MTQSSISNNRAISEENKFLKKAESLAPKLTNTKFFSVNSWSKDGTPSCKILNKQISIDAWMFIQQMNNEAIRKALNTCSKPYYDSRMAKNKKSVISDISKILNLNDPSEDSPIIQISI